MRKSTKIFVIIWAIPLIIGILSIILWLLVYSIKCENIVCKNIVEATWILHWFILLGVFYTIPWAYLLSFIYNFIFDKVNKTHLTNENFSKKISFTKIKNFFITFWILIFIKFLLDFLRNWY